MTTISTNEYLQQIDNLNQLIYAIEQVNEKIENNNISVKTNFRKGMVLVTNEYGKIVESNVKTSKLQFLNNLTAPIQKQLDELYDKLSEDMLDELLISQREKQNTLRNLSYQINSLAIQLSLDDITQGTTNKYIINDTYDSDINITGQLSVSKNINVSNAYTQIDTTNYHTKYMELIQENTTETITEPILKVTQKGVLNLLDIQFDYNSALYTPSKIPIFSIANDGSVGIRTNAPTEKLHVVGNMHVSGNINSITSAELSYLKGVEEDIQNQLDFITDKSTDLSISLSQDLIDADKRTSNDILNILTEITNATDQMQTNIELSIVELGDSKQDKLTYGEGLGYDSNTNSVYTTRISEWTASENNDYISYSNVQIHSNYIISIQDNVSKTLVLQSELDTKLDKTSVTGAITSVVSNNLNPNHILFSDSNGKISTIGATQEISSSVLDNLIGITGNVQQQIDNINSEIISTSNQFSSLVENYETSYSNIITTELLTQNNALDAKQDKLIIGAGIEYDSNTNTIQISGAVEQAIVGTNVLPIEEYWKARCFFNEPINLMILYKFDSNNFLINHGYLGAKYNLTNVNATIDNTDPAVGDADANLTVSSAYLQMNDTFSTNGLTSFSVAFWMKKSTLNSSWDVVLHDSGTSTATYNEFRILRYSNTNYWVVRVFNSLIYTDGYLNDWDASDLDVWHHYVFNINKTINNNTSVSVYKDGWIVGSSTDESSIWTSGIINNILLGRHNNDNSSLKGYLDDFRMYDRVLTDDEINKLYNKSTTTEYISYGDDMLDKYGSLVFYNDVSDILTWLKLDGSNEDHSKKINMVDISEYGNITYDDVIKIYDKSVNFNGSSYIQLNNLEDNSQYFTPQNMTVSFWIYGYSNISSIQTIVSACDTSAFSGWMINITASGLLSLWYGSGTTWNQYNIANTNYSSRTSEWIHISLCISYKLLYLYVDGKYITTIYITNTIQYGCKYLRVGSDDTSSYYLTSGVKLNDLRIYNRTLTLKEAYLLYYTSGYNGKLKNIIEGNNDMLAWYKFDGDFTDSSGNGNDATAYGSEYMFDDTNAIIKKSVYFNGNSQYLTIPATNFGVFDGLTFSTWIYFTENRAYERIFDFGNGSSLNNIGITRENNTNHLKPFIFNNTSVSTYLYNNVIVNNTWMHVCWTIQKSPISWKLYINGIFINPSSTSGTPRFPDNLSLANSYIGKSGANDPLFKGNMDDFRIYERALTADEVNDIYKYGFYNISNKNTSYISIYNDKIIIKPDISIATTDDMANKQNALIFSYGLHYNPATKELVAGGWKKNNDHISHGNVKVYDSKISFDLNTYDIPALIRKYPPSNLSSGGDTEPYTENIINAGYANGSYTISASSYYGIPYYQSMYFNNVSGGGSSADGKYTQTSGEYIGTSSISSYNGEWIKIKMPVGIFLSYIKIYQQTSYESRSPKKYRVYGSINDSNWNLLIDETNASYSNAIHQSVNINTTSAYNYYVLVVNQLVGGDTNSTLLNFDEWKIYGRESQSAFISAEDFYNNTDDMLLWCNFDGDIIDSSGNYIGTPTGAGTLTYDTQNKVIGTSSITFNGSSYIQLDNPVVNGVSDVSYWTPTSMTVSFWIKGYSIHTAHQAILSARNNVQISGAWVSSGWIIYIMPNSGDLSWWFGRGSNGWGQYVIPYSTLSQFTNNWMHIVYTFSGSTMHLYINGVLISSKTDWSDIKFDCANLRIGAGANEETAQFILKSGTQLDDVRIYNRALTATEINTIYNINNIRQSYEDSFGKSSIESGTVITQNINPLYSTGTIKFGKNIEISNGKTSSESYENIVLSSTENAYSSSTIADYCMTSKKDIWLDGADVIFTSDERIKKEIEDIDDDSALEKIMLIQPKTYKYIANKERGNDRVYGFISQQIKDVLPEATSETSRFIPNIYKQCICDEHIITLPNDYDISELVSRYKGETLSNKVRIIDSKNKTFDMTYSLIMNDDENTKMRVKGVIPHINNTIFVYGTLIDDLTTIDKSYIYTLNVCATQRLSRKVDTLNASMIDINSLSMTLDDRITALENKMNAEINNI